MTFGNGVRHIFCLSVVQLLTKNHFFLVKQFLWLSNLDGDYTGGINPSVALLCF